MIFMHFFSSKTTHFHSVTQMTLWTCGMACQIRALLHGMLHVFYLDHSKQHRASLKARMFSEQVMLTVIFGMLQTGSRLALSLLPPADPATAHNLSPPPPPPPQILEPVPSTLYADPGNSCLWHTGAINISATRDDWSREAWGAWASATSATGSMGWARPLPQAALNQI